MTDRDRPRLTAGDLTSREKSALVFQMVLVLGSVPDLAVALVRFARRDRGVQLGPTLVSLLLAAGAPGVARWAFRRQGRLAGAAVLGYGAAVPLVPAAAGAVRWTVVGTGNPLWQLALSAAMRVVGGCLTVLPAALAVARRRRAAELTAA